jgi:hypothetical protein
VLDIPTVGVRLYAGNGLSILKIEIPLNESGKFKKMPLFKALN